MSRDWRMFLDDMIACCRRVQKYTAGLDKDCFIASEMNYDATVRNIELIGEAAKYIPTDIRNQMPDIPWREIIAARNILAHGYFGVNDDILWDMIVNEIPELTIRLERFLRT